jgi:Flp pilus assembly protein TadG
MSNLPKKPDLTLRRNRRRTGNTITELAFMLMPTLALIFGFLDIGFAIFTWNTLQNAVREGARYAITYQVDGSGEQRQSIRNRVAAWSMGFVSASARVTTGPQTAGAPPPPYVEINYYSQANMTAPLPNGTGGTAANRTGNIVEVAIRRYPYQWMAPFSGSLQSPFYATQSTPLIINVYSSDVLGGTPIAGAPAIGNP